MKIPNTITKAGMLLPVVLAIAVLLAGCTVLDGNVPSVQATQGQTQQSGQANSGSSGIGTAAVSLAISGVTSADYGKDDLTEAVADGDTVYVRLLGDSASVGGHFL